MRHLYSRKGEPAAAGEPRTRRVREEAALDTPSGMARVRGERGVVLLLALVALLLIAAIGAAIIFMASSESSIVGAQKVGARSYYASAGGLEEARYRVMTSIPNDLGGLNHIDFTNPANTAAPFTADFARLPAIPGPGVPPSEILYIVNVNNPLGAANSDAVGDIPPLTEDPLRTAEVGPDGALTFRGVASIQPDAGNPNLAVPYEWIRINLKTESAAQQDLNFDGFLSPDPIFLFMGRQYTATDLLAYDLDGIGAGTLIPGDILPPPWGRDPIPLGVDDRPCFAVICATPVYMLTARAEVPLPGSPPTSRLIRAEVAVPFSFSIDASILSEPGITVNGAMFSSGRDICDPDCKLRADGVSPYHFADPQDALFKGYDVSDVPAACKSFFPMQSEAPKTSQKAPAASAVSDPICNDPADPGCFCDKGVCIQGDAVAKYDLDQLIAVLKPMARVLQPPVDSYYPQTDKSTLNLVGDVWSGTALELGGFPFADPINQTGPDPVNGVGADPIITYVPGNFKCTAKCTGSGILIVDGDFEMNASMAFYGAVLVRGDVKVAGVGKAPTPCNIYGALITRGGVSTDFSGSICFQYNSCAQRNASFFAPTLNLSFREMPQ